MHVIHLLVLFASLSLSMVSANADTFVYRSANQLYADGKPFYHLGFNAVWMPSSVAFGLTQRVDHTLDAAQRMGLKVVRVWGFNDKFPFAPGQYDEGQGRGLDCVIAGAGRRGIRVELALADFWEAYLGPEVWLRFAEGSVGGLDMADFYRNQKVLQLLKEHILAVTSRVNSLTGVTYKDDPSIIGYNLFNEPRCPGCSGDDMAARNAFINALADTLRAAAPKQLTFSGTEGFFAAGDPSVGYNPGRGAQCEGEDWTSEIRNFDVATIHMYWRQLESFQQSRTNLINNDKPGFDFNVQYLQKKLRLYSRLARDPGRPLVVEEFGLTKRYFDAEQIKVVVAVVADALIAARREGSPLMGAWIWQAAPIGDPDVGGYDVALTKGTSGQVVGLGRGGARPSGSSSSSGPQSGPTSSLLSTNQDSIESSKSDGFTTDDSSSGSSSGTGTSLFNDGSSTNSEAAVGRKLLEVTGPLVVNPAEDVLGSFRREAARAACAVAVTVFPEQSVPWEVDMQAYRDLVAPHDIVDILAEAARLLDE